MQAERIKLNIQQFHIFFAKCGCWGGSVWFNRSRKQKSASRGQRLEERLGWEPGLELWPGPGPEREQGPGLGAWGKGGRRPWRGLGFGVGQGRGRGWGFGTPAGAGAGLGVEADWEGVLYFVITSHDHHIITSQYCSAPSRLRHHQSKHGQARMKALSPSETPMKAPSP